MLKSKDFSLNKFLAGKNLAVKMIDFYAVFLLLTKRWVRLSGLSFGLCREVGGGLSMSHFFRKISYLNVLNLNFEKS